MRKLSSPCNADDARNNAIDDASNDVGMEKAMVQAMIRAIMQAIKQKGKHFFLSRSEIFLLFHPFLLLLISVTLFVVSNLESISEWDIRVSLFTVREHEFYSLNRIPEVEVVKTIAYH